MKKPVIALVGSPNVGKSTIFNRLVGTKISIIDDTPGITRDRIYGNVHFKDNEYILIDTGGIDINSGKFTTDIKGQALLAINEADLVLFVVDGKLGLTANDYLVRDMLNKAHKNTIVLINKTDAKLFKEHEYDFYELGFQKYFSVSGEQNYGFYDLQEEIIKQFPNTKDEYDNNIIKFSVIGRPNVGKSSLVNALLNEERVIVSKHAGTTRDAVDTTFTYHDDKFVVIDTAGMRKKGRIYENVEKYSLLRSLKAIDRSDICVVVIDADEGIVEHDKHIVGYALEAGKGIVLVVNKWDLIDNKEEEIKKWKLLIKNEFQFISYVPIVFLSALTKKKIGSLMPTIIQVNNNCKKHIETNLINDVIMDAYNLNLPPSYKSKRLKIYFTNQVSSCPPVFNIQVNNKGLVHFSYQRYLENKIRESFDFGGTPIIIQFKNKGEHNN